MLSFSALVSSSEGTLLTQAPSFLKGAEYHLSSWRPDRNLKAAMPMVLFWANCDESVLQNCMSRCQESRVA